MRAMQFDYGLLALQITKGTEFEVFRACRLNVKLLSRRIHLGGGSRLLGVMHRLNHRKQVISSPSFRPHHHCMSPTSDRGSESHAVGICDIEFQIGDRSAAYLCIDRVKKAAVSHWSRRFDKTNLDAGSVFGRHGS
jgi:hypothetical protein